MLSQTRIPFETLADLVDNCLSEGEEAEVRRQLADADQATRDDLAWLQALDRFRTEMPLETPPEQAREALRAHFRRWAEGRRRPSLFQRLVAQLAFDSRVQPVLAGARGGAGEPDQLLYTSDRMDIELHVLPAGPSRVRVLGQALARDQDVDLTGCAVQLLAREQELSLTCTNELGEFTFEAAPGTDYTLILVSEEGEIALEQLDLTSGRTD